MPDELAVDGNDPPKSNRSSGRVVVSEMLQTPQSNNVLRGSYSERGLLRMTGGLEEVSCKLHCIAVPSRTERGSKTGLWHRPRRGRTHGRPPWPR